MRLLATFLLTFVCTVLYSQKTYVIRDQFSKEVVPFAKVYPNLGDPVLADLDGMVDLDENVSQVKIKAHGYQDTSLFLDQISDGFLEVKLVVQTLDEITVVPGENPAHRIIKLVMANRKTNHPLENTSFQYEAYTKFLVEADEALIKSIPDTTKDSNMVSMKEFLKSTHIFLIESQSQRTFIPPYRDKEVVNSYKVSGLSNPLFATIANQLQSFHFYDNQVELSGKQYINPIALGGTRRYLFVLEDTTLVGQDSIFHIRFRPFKNSNFKGMKGVLYVNSNGWAIQKVQATSAEPDEVMQLEIIQEYKLLENKYWFPSKLSSSIIFTSAQIAVGDTSLPLLANSHTDISDVVFDPPNISKKGFDNVNVEVASGASDKSEEEWEAKRTATLTEKERNTYRVIDSIAEEENLDRMIRIFEILSSGKIPLGYVNIPLARLFDYNQYEGFRLGFGLETSDKLSERVTLGAYGAYGFRDKGFKYGASVGLLAWKRKDLRFILSAQNDLLTRGSEEVFDEQNLFSSAQLSKIYMQWMDHEIAYSAGLQIRPKANLQVSAKARLKHVRFLQDYSFSDPHNPLMQSYQGMDLKELVGGVEWHLFQQYMKIKNRYIPTRLNKPVFKMTIVAGQASFEDGTISDMYIKPHFSWRHEMNILGLGKFDYKIEGASMALGQTRAVPMALLYQPRTSMHPDYKLSVSVQYSYETLNSVNYFFTEFTGLVTQLKFNPLRLGDDFRPQISLHHALLIGRLDHINSHQNVNPSNNPLFGFQEARAGHAETGLLFNNVLNNVGAGIFYNYGPTGSVNWNNNMFVKLTVTKPF